MYPSTDRHVASLTKMSATTTTTTIICKMKRYKQRLVSDDGTNLVHNCPPLSSYSDPEILYLHSVPSTLPYTCAVSSLQAKMAARYSGDIATNGNHHSRWFFDCQSSMHFPFCLSSSNSSVINPLNLSMAPSLIKLSSSSCQRWNRGRNLRSMPLCLLTLLIIHVILWPVFVVVSSQSIATSSHYYSLTMPVSQQAAPAGCEWRARSASSHMFGHMASGATNNRLAEDQSHDPSNSHQSGSEMVLTCHFRTLNGPLDSGANLSLIPVDQTIGLALICEDILFESSLPNRSFERLHQLRELYIERCKLSELSADVFYGLTELRQLTVRTRNTDWGDLSLRLSPTVFSPIRRLEQLDLSENGLTMLPSPLFCSLSRLQFLNVSSNVIGDVASFGFSAKSSYDQPTSSSVDCRRLDAITHLDAAHNRIKVLTDRGFGRLHRLQNLNLRHNLIVRAEETSLAGLGELSRLDLSNNQLVALPARFFQAVKSTLTELYLQNNSISVIPPGLFSGLSQVTVLDLSHNEVTSHWIGPNTFSDMSKLLSLDLSYNKLTRIDATAFRALYTLQSLSLQHNEIESLAENAFAANRNLHTLSLSGNRLTSLDAASFAGLVVLSSLALDSNRILHIHPTSFANITGLTELNLGQNRLEAVPAAISPLHTLRSLDLSYNRIREIGNASYLGLEHLYGLNIEGNLIGNLSRGDFVDLPSLRVLNLAHNRIQSVEEKTFDDIFDLHALRLDSNGLENVNNLFLNLHDLLMLNVSANRIVQFDYAMIPMALQWLDIHQNQIDQLSNFYSIESELKLRTLDASYNRITEIIDASLPNGIEVVLLNRNVIRKIAPHTFAKKANLTRVDLSENRLSSLDLNSLRLSRVPDRRPLPEFSIVGNPFLCDCNMEWLQRAAMANPTGRQQFASVPPSVEDSRLYPRVVDVQLVQCRLPFGRSSGGATSSSALTPLASLRSTQFLCSYRSHCFALCHCCEFDACDCEMTCPDNCTCFYDQSWNTNIVDCGANQHLVVPGRIPMDVTDLYLDGNNIPELSPHTFIGRKNMRHLYLNSSHIRAINNRTFNGLRSLIVLNLANNELDTLYGYEFERLSDLRELYLQNNRISVIGNRTFTALRSLRVLQLDHNRIVEFELWTGLAHNSQLQDLYIGVNDWSCDCLFVSHLMEWLPIRSDIIRDLQLVHCQYNDTYALPLAPVALTDANSADIKAARANISAACDQYEKRSPSIAEATKTLTSNLPLGPVPFNVPVIVLVIASTLAVLLVLIMIVTAVLYRHEISVWFYTRTGIRVCGGGAGKNGRRRRTQYGADDNDEKLFDAFVSYSKKDEAFVTQMLSPELEYGSTPMRICLYYRDLPLATGFMSDAIVEAMASSRRTILVISENFLRGEWCQFEFKSAHQEALRSRARHKLILIFVGPVVGKDLDPDIRMWLKTSGNTCLQWGEKMFWEKMRYAMPEIPASGSSGTSSSSSSTTSSSYGRKGQLTKGGTLPALTSLSQSPLAQSRHAIDSYGHHGHLQHIPASQLSAHHPLLSAGMHHTTLGRNHYQQSQSQLYSPSSVHSQQSTYAYPTYYPPTGTLHPSILSSHHSTPPPLPPAHPLQAQIQQQFQQQQQQQQHSFQHSLNASIDQGSGPIHLSHHMPHLQHHQRGGGPNSSESSLMNSSGGTTVTSHLSNGSESGHSSNGGGGVSQSVPFVPSASSTTAVAVHI